MHDQREWSREAARLADALTRQQSPVVLVTNEVGLGIVPDNALARAFREAGAGRVFIGLSERWRTAPSWPKTVASTSRARGGCPSG